jgi:hypothetical protein
MKGMRFVRGAAISLAALGLILPPSASADTETKPTAVVRPAKSLAADVVLQEGAFAGRVVDHTGTPLAGHDVIVKQGDKQVAIVKTNDKGVFSVPAVRPGTYTATSGKTVGTFRVWNDKAAPPAAKGHALLVMGQNGSRGQFGAVDPTLVLLTAAVIATLIITAITLNKVNDLEDEVSQIPKSN